jgi:hypothetical protein
MGTGGRAGKKAARPWAGGPRENPPDVVAADKGKEETPAANVSGEN